MERRMDREQDVQTKRDELTERFGSDLLFADNFDSSIIGVTTGFNSGIVVYDGNKMAKELMYQHNMTDEEAWEYLEYNVFGAYVGEKTPIYVLD
jgi:hypothetical protein